MHGDDHREVIEGAGLVRETGGRRVSALFRPRRMPQQRSKAPDTGCMVPDSCGHATCFPEPAASG